MMVESQDALTQEIVARELEDLTMYLYKVLDVATQRARDFFLQDGGDILDPYLYPCLVRYYAKQALTKDAESRQFMVADIENNGLYLVYRHYHIKIFKSAKDGGLPPAGFSRIRQWFYCQKTLWSPQDLASIEPYYGKRSLALNLILLWDAAATKMLQLKLACPKYSSVSRAIADWVQDIQHPAYSLGEEERTSAYPDDLDEDLDISINGDDINGDDMHLA